MRDRLLSAGRVVVEGSLLVVVALIVVLAVPQVVGAKASYVVLSGSMHPTIEPGSVVVVRDTPPAAIDRGDVITYRVDADESYRVTHRVVAVNSTPDGPVFRTKGDANDDPDPWRVTPSQVVGRVWFNVPLVGYLAVFARTPLGSALLVVIPGLALVASGVRTLVS